MIALLDADVGIGQGALVAAGGNIGIARWAVSWPGGLVGLYAQLSAVHGQAQVRSTGRLR